MLLWEDVLKLFIPFLLSILFFLIKDWLSKHKEKKAKQESIWRLLTVEVRRVGADIKGLESLIEAYDGGMYAGFTHNLDESIKRMIQRLSELDPSKTYVYAKYESSHAQVENHINSLCHIIHSLITTKDINEERAKGAIKSQVMVLIESMVEMSESSVEVMEVLQNDNKRNSVFDEQILRELNDSISKLKPNK
ncbi:hypothetical protein [Aliikangiella sp. IMCC44359]|uniref:hypothetical protein n=1 Tax=Aliikangiella sp. IMCC44359 TaxID=3459125 RepID=UPI00403B30A6